MYKKILIAVDINAEAEELMIKAKAMAETHGAKYHAVYAIENPVAAMGDLHAGHPLLNVTQLKHEFLPLLQAAAAKADIAANDVSVLVGHINDDIIDYASKGDYDLIIVGSHGKHGLQLLLGSTANAILHRAKIDVLAMRL